MPFDLLCLLSCRHSLWYGTASGCDDTGFLTLTLVGCDGRCVVSVFCCDEFGSGGVPVVGCQQVLLFNFWEVSSMSMVVWDSTGSPTSTLGFQTLETLTKSTRTQVK